MSRVEKASRADKSAEKAFEELSGIALGFLGISIGTSGVAMPLAMIPIVAGLGLATHAYLTLPDPTPTHHEATERNGKANSLPHPTGSFRDRVGGIFSMAAQKGGPKEQASAKPIEASRSQGAPEVTYVKGAGMTGLSRMALE